MNERPRAFRKDVIRKVFYRGFFAIALMFLLCSCSEVQTSVAGLRTSQERRDGTGPIAPTEERKLYEQAQDASVKIKLLLEGQMNVIDRGSAGLFVLPKELTNDPNFTYWVLITAKHVVPEEENTPLLPPRRIELEQNGHPAGKISIGNYVMVEDTDDLVVFVLRSGVEDKDKVTLMVPRQYSDDLFEDYNSSGDGLYVGYPSAVDGGRTSQAYQVRVDAGVPESEDWATMSPVNGEMLSPGSSGGLLWTKQGKVIGVQHGTSMIMSFVTTHLKTKIPPLVKKGLEILRSLPVPSSNP